MYTGFPARRMRPTVRRSWNMWGHHSIIKWRDHIRRTVGTGWPWRLHAVTAICYSTKKKKVSYTKRNKQNDSICFLLDSSK